MVSKSQIKLITSLHQKKYRVKTGLFIAEGIKVINEYAEAGFKLYLLFATDPEPFKKVSGNIELITDPELKKISRLNTPNTGVAIFYIPENTPITYDALLVALDGVNDPGNLGTIIRLCDWFGVTHLVCSENTVDCYNPKVIQATMGSLSRVNIVYRNLPEFLSTAQLPTFAAMMHGENVYTSNLPVKGILVMGNEANGITEEVQKLIQHSITIPRFGDLQQTESLNVATATAILLSEFKRRR